jgi:RHS repeat-associated protein
VLGTQTLGYDGASEHRGLPTAITDSGLGGAITATYDADATLTTQTMPNGITATRTIDPSGDVTKVAYAKTGSFWFDDRQDSNIHGQWRIHFGPSGSEVYGYDPAGRLGAVWDTRNAQPCVQRSYGFDADSNRTALDSYPANAGGTCPPGTTPTTTSYSYDAADRLQPTGTAAGLTYDAFGRTTTLPATLAGGTQTTIGYYTTDMVASQTQGAVTRSWTLDPARRLRAAAMTGQPTKTNHYTDTSDAPAWIDEGDGTRTRYVTGLDGNLVAAVTSTGTTVTGVRYQLVGLHGDVITTTSPGAATPDGAFLDYNEYGSPRGATPTARYGWLGGKQRSTDSLGGVTLMGVRLYAPALGRFLQVDPVEGGSANRYDYSFQDPVNQSDPLGTYTVWHRWNYGYSWVVYRGTWHWQGFACTIWNPVGWFLCGVVIQVRWVKVDQYRNRDWYVLIHHTVGSTWWKWNHYKTYQTVQWWKEQEHACVFAYFFHGCTPPIYLPVQFWNGVLGSFTEWLGVYYNHDWTP